MTDRDSQISGKAPSPKAPPRSEDSGDKGQSSKALAQMLGKLIALVLVVILALLIERYCSYKPPAFGPDAKISAIDGDSIRAGNGDEYRLFGIDAPELHQTCKDANGKSWLCGRAAKAKLTTLLKAGGVNCEARATDNYGRIVAVCSAQGVPDLGEAMVSAGYAIDLGAPAGNPYQAAESEAKDAKRGIWRGTFDRPSDWRQAHPREGD
ncbi:thermonuclease family protein [Methyloceanibacter sp.]|uniref:thermonuclease family protein n=1 Tax=Methyloceanibacter sp. TaxID=1965321 RepID=UPI002D6DF74F|nr:thermonuclease family protein [Methyloceanibacter sp.]HZP10395.1 thermonuclease family protein [Methyloceanibacter sp.]